MQQFYEENSVDLVHILFEEQIVSIFLDYFYVRSRYLCYEDCKHSVLCDTDFSIITVFSYVTSRF